MVCTNLGADAVSNGFSVGHVFAQIVQSMDFEANWLKAQSIDDLKNLILLAERIRKGQL